MDINGVFNQFLRETEPVDIAQRIINDSENEFIEMKNKEDNNTETSNECISLQDEKTNIEKEISILEKKLRSIKNVRNYRSTSINNQQSNLRKKIRLQISKLKDRLVDIAVEEKGSKSGADVIKSTVPDILTPTFEQLNI